MGSADFSQFVVTTVNGTACETSTLKVHALSPHLPATSTGISSNFWTLSLLADLSEFPSLIYGSCSLGQGFAYSFLQIPPHDGHPCCSAMYFVVAYAYSGLSPVRARPWRAYQKTDVCNKHLFSDLTYRAYNSIAPTGQAASHAPHSTHVFSSISYLPSPIEIAPIGQVCSHVPHAMHLSVILYAI